MKPELLEKLKDRFDAHTYSVLCDDCDSIKSRERKKTNAQRIYEQTAGCKNPKLKMYDAIVQAEISKTKKNLIVAAKSAAQLDDFITALYWHTQIKLDPIDIDEKFYRLKLSFLASAQKKHNPTAQPITSAKQMLQDTNLAKKLEDKTYLDLEIECKVLENEYYHKEFDEIADSALASQQENFAKAQNAGFLRLALVWIAGIAWLIWSTPKVWVWADNFFDQHLGLLFLVFWVVPIAYVIALLIGIFMLGEAIAGKKSDKLSESIDRIIKSKIEYIDRELTSTTPYQKRQEMDRDIPVELCNYDSRLLLALLSRLYGEESIGRVLKLPQKTLHSTWIERFAGNKESGDYPYKNKILELLSNEYDFESAFLALELAKREKHNVTARESEIERAFFSPYYKNIKLVHSLCFAFLCEEIKKGEENSCTDQIGEACYFIYQLSKEKAIGQRAIDCKNRKMMFIVMEAAIMHWDNYRFGYTRYDAEKYIKVLEEEGDPDGARLRKILNEQIAYEERQRIQDSTIEAREREKAEREAYAIRREKERRADSVERDINFYLYGDYSTEFERMVGGKISFTDYTYSDEIRNKILETRD